MTILNRLSALVVLIFLALNSLSYIALEASAAERKVDLVIVQKQQRILKLMSGGDLVHQYRIALGFDPQGPKRREGDGRTPEGAYRIDWRNPHSAFHLSLHIDYPSPTDGSAAVAAAESPGKDIMIHGLPNGFTAEQVGHPFTDWTSGCIAVTNAQIEEIWRLVDDGTAILILPR